MSQPSIYLVFARHPQGIIVTITRRVEVPGRPARITGRRHICPMEEPFTWEQALRVAASLLLKEAGRLRSTPIDARRPASLEGPQGENPQP
jgi:hypothetical protein